MLAPHAGRRFWSPTGHQDHTSTAGLRGMYKRWSAGLHLRLHKVTAATLPGISVSHSWPRPTCKSDAQAYGNYCVAFSPAEAAHEILHSFDKTPLMLCFRSWALTYFFYIVNGEDLTCGQANTRPEDPFDDCF